MGDGVTTFENGGTATLNADGKLVLERVTPGDKVVFDVVMENNSNVNIQYRVKWTTESKLAEVLEMTVVETDVKENVGIWTMWQTPADEAAKYKRTTVTLELPVEVGNEYQTAEAEIYIYVEAVQGNGVVTVETAEELAAALANAKPGTTVQLGAGEFGTITLGKLENVVIAATSENANCIIVTDENTDIKDVTIKDFAFNYNGTNNFGITIGTTANIENLVIDNCVFDGPGGKSGRAIFGHNPEATISITNCVFKNMGYPIYTTGTPSSFASLKIDSCTFENLYSWAIMPQYGEYTGELIVTNCTFNKCANGLVKTGTFVDDSSFTFANNTLVDCGPHPGANLFRVNYNEGATIVIEGNIVMIEGEVVETNWIPGAEQGIIQK